MYYYRDSNQTEIDLLIEQDGLFHPIEKKLQISIKTISRPLTALLSLKKCQSPFCRFLL
ncbi:MAG: DUF4143 domain-containing protein [Treponema sp.]|nr:DUF4143 domain-containing protein [Treponema sp.]